MTTILVSLLAVFLVFAAPANAKTTTSTPVPATKGLPAPSSNAGVKAAAASAADLVEKEKGLVEQNAPGETAYLAGGCFWGMEDLLKSFPGVISTEVGYMGGKIKNATYEIVHTGASNHAETVKVIFDNKKTSYEKLLKFFFRIHNPTTMNQQGNDKGTQYRSNIFYVTEDQRKTAQEVKSKVNNSKKWDDPVVTLITPAGEFWKAEEYHQKYLVKNPGGYTCHFVRDFDFK